MAFNVTYALESHLSDPLLTAGLSPVSYQRSDGRKVWGSGGLRLAQRVLFLGNGEHKKPKKALSLWGSLKSKYRHG